MPEKFRRKPEFVTPDELEAVCWDGELDTFAAIKAWGAPVVLIFGGTDGNAGKLKMTVRTIFYLADVGDWIVCAKNGEFGVYDAALFDEYYAPIL